MVLLDQVIQILHRPQLATGWKSTFLPEFSYGLGVRRVAVDVDNAKRYGVSGT